jgi:hypothetical protein
MVRSLAGAGSMVMPRLVSRPRVIWTAWLMVLWWMPKMAAGTRWGTDRRWVSTVASSRAAGPGAPRYGGPARDAAGAAAPGVQALLARGVEPGLQGGGQGGQVPAGHPGQRGAVQGGGDRGGVAGRGRRPGPGGTVKRRLRGVVPGTAEGVPG